jgi:membrane protein
MMIFFSKINCTFTPLKKKNNIRNLGKNIWHLLSQTFSEFNNDNGTKLSASLSYYTIFALPPLLIIIISLCSFFFGAEAVRGEIFGQINGLVGNAAALQIQETIKNVKLSGDNFFMTSLSIVILMIGASGVFAEIQDSINYIWGVKAKPKRGLIKFLKNRLMSFSMIGSVGFLLLVSLIVNSLMDIFSSKLTNYMHRDTVFLLYGMNVLIVFVINTILFTIIFRTLPDGKIVLRDCLVGASVTSILFMTGKFAIGAYLGKSAIATIYGAAGSVILILGWVYYSAIILYFGAEFTKVYALTHGQKIIPNNYSVLIIKQIEVEPAQKEPA